MENCQLTTAALIDAYEREKVLWHTLSNATEVDKELAWARLSTIFSIPTGMTYATLYIAWCFSLLIFLRFSRFCG